MKNIIIILLVICLFSCKDNIHKEYYETGELKATYKMEGGKLNGEKKVYFKDGTLEWEVEYKDDKENGVFRKYNKMGILIATAFFKNGIEDGIEKLYYENGKIEKEAFFVNGTKDSIYKEYYINGKLKKVGQYDNGTFLYYKKYDQSGKLIDWKGEVVIKSINGDTIMEGETYKASIELLGPYEAEKIIFKAALAPLLRFVLLLPSKENKAQLETPPMPKGFYVIKVYVKVNDSDSNLTIRKEILVLSKSKKSSKLKHSS